MGNLDACVAAGVHAVVGTTGFTDDRLAALRDLLEGTPDRRAGRPQLRHRRRAHDALRRAGGPLLRLRRDRRAAPPRQGRRAERHRPAHRRARRAGPRGDAARCPTRRRRLLDGARGADVSGVRVHAVRLAGLVAHQEVLLGGSGETLTLRHDSYDRASFMPGVLLGVRAGRVPAGPDRGPGRPARPVRARTTAVLLVGVTGAARRCTCWSGRSTCSAPAGSPGCCSASGSLLLVAVGAVLLAGEVRFGLDTQRLGERLAREGGLPEVPADTAAAAQRPADHATRPTRCSPSGGPRSRRRRRTGGRGSGSRPPTATPATPRGAGPRCGGPCAPGARRPAEPARAATRPYETRRARPAGTAVARRRSW